MVRREMENVVWVVVFLTGVVSVALAGDVKRSDDPSPLVDLVQRQGDAIQRMDVELSDLRDKLASRTQQVAFTVQFSADPVNNLGEHATLKFDQVITNIGNGYNPNTGIFRAPTPGLYTFFLKVMSTNTDGEIIFTVSKGGTRLASVFAGGQADPGDQGSVQVTVHVPAQEEIWVMHEMYDTACRGAWWTVFTGFLVMGD